MNSSTTAPGGTRKTGGIARLNLLCVLLVSRTKSGSGVVATEVSGTILDWVISSGTVVQPMIIVVAKTEKVRTSFDWDVLTEVIGKLLLAAQPPRWGLY
ncbi:MAG: hypothetical protein O7C75_01980 [Verrucomicrobia bacterium]|nr:hypothetical protein [Verrucomicrobiota bacterium]